MADNDKIAWALNWIESSCLWACVHYTNSLAPVHYQDTSLSQGIGVLCSRYSLWTHMLRSLISNLGRLTLTAVVKHLQDHRFHRFYSHGSPKPGNRSTLCLSSMKTSTPSPCLTSSTLDFLHQSSHFIADSEVWSGLCGWSLDTDGCDLVEQLYVFLNIGQG
ncbi:hypothetical protein BJV74DRAFT_338811 [Russula compacta]|nr:hypothetical protein BJV74DRAFT_338811 [Russula compacta]